MPADDERLEEEIDEQGENPTQQRIGEGEPRPVDADWSEESWGETGSRDDASDG